MTIMKTVATRVVNSLAYRVAISVLTMVYTQNGWAYVPPSQFILGNWTTKHSIHSKVVKIRNIITEFDQGKATPVHFKETVIYSASTMNLKSMITDDADQRLYSNEKTMENLPPISKLLLCSDLSKNTDALKNQGIPIRNKEDLLVLPGEAERLQSEVVTLARYQGQLSNLAWVISAAKRETEFTTPQIWFEKDTFNLLRLIYQEARDQQFYEFQLEDFRFFHEFAYPKILQVKKDNDVLFSSQMVDLTILNSDSTVLKSFRISNSENGYSDLGRSAPAALKNLIQRYSNIVR